MKRGRPVRIPAGKEFVRRTVVAAAEVVVVVALGRVVAAAEVAVAPELDHD